MMNEHPKKARKFPLFEPIHHQPGLERHLKASAAAHWSLIGPTGSPARKSNYNQSHESDRIEEVLSKLDRLEFKIITITTLLGIGQLRRSAV
ncbi:hypothetical protein CPSG_00527 [Coccidioides posadasii str. Silveira]|uniref:Uncharacterized protein n=1 Tax=Coccidioides posadasii (strain RMSCC 757 / Silveira) TaxID=443226 RepID=E9CSG8_COCPS|nr:hypothetical protein CPSG_00527 [Coccidioides posadasii str. Silveira]